MRENSGTSLIVNYQHVHKALTFSDLSQFSVPDEAFGTFVREMSDAFEVMRELRGIAQTAVSDAQKAEVFELLSLVVAVTVVGYRPNAVYTRECYQAYAAALKNPNMEHPPDVLTKIAMEERLGPFVRELRHLITSLRGYMGLIQEHSPSDAEKQEYLATVDKIIAHILKTLDLYKRQLITHRRKNEISLTRCAIWLM